MHKIHTVTIKITGTSNKYPTNSHYDSAIKKR